VKRRIAVLLVVAALGYACLGPSGGPAPPPAIPAPASWTPNELNVAWVGHASVLIGFAGTTLLTDPAFFDRVGPQIGPITIGPRRLVAPALMPDDLPPLDAVVLSHAHMDSLDRPSLRAVARGRLLVTPPRTRDLVDDLGFARIVELGWGEKVTAGDVEIEAIEVDHWGKRWPWERWRGYNGYLFARGTTVVLFAPDTAYTPTLGRLARERHVTAMIQGNGAYDPWIHNHAAPEQVWDMFVQSGARALIPVHWDTFRLGREPIGDAIARLLAAAGPQADRVVVRQIGDTWTAPCCGS